MSLAEELQRINEAAHAKAVSVFVGRGWDAELANGMARLLLIELTHPAAGSRAAQEGAALEKIARWDGKNRLSSGLARFVGETTMRLMQVAIVQEGMRTYLPAYCAAILTAFDKPDATLEGLASDLAARKVPPMLCEMIAEAVLGTVMAQRMSGSRPDASLLLSFHEVAEKAEEDLTPPAADLANNLRRTLEYGEQVHRQASRDAVGVLTAKWRILEVFAGMHEDLPAEA